MKKILIVDDAIFMRLVLKNMILKHSQFEVIGEASNGKEAIEKYKILKPDLITMDITMPEMDGLEALKQIKLIDKNANVIMVSAIGQESIIRNCIINGAKSFIVKPFVEDYIMNILDKFQLALSR